MISDTYEPGSTFKLVTTSSALEEGVTSLNHTYTCNVGYKVPGTNVTLHCWSPMPHGTETLKEAVGNSCNPVQIQLGLALGEDTYYDYLEMFGITADSKTGIDLPGEGSAILSAKRKHRSCRTCNDVLRAGCCNYADSACYSRLRHRKRRGADAT